MFELDSLYYLSPIIKQFTDGEWTTIEALIIVVTINTVLYAIHEFHSLYFSKRAKEVIGYAILIIVGSMIDQISVTSFLEIEGYSQIGVQSYLIIKEVLKLIHMLDKYYGVKIPFLQSKIEEIPHTMDQQEELERTIQEIKNQVEELKNQKSQGVE